MESDAMYTIEADDVVNFTGGPGGMEGRAKVIEVYQNGKVKIRCGSQTFKVDKKNCEIIFKGG